MEAAAVTHGHHEHEHHGPPEANRSSRVDPSLLGMLLYGLVNLLQRSERLYERVRHLDKRMYVEVAAEDAPRPVQAQFDRLAAAFGG